MLRQRLVPLRVPWDVSVGVAGLKVTFWEDNRTEVEFVGVWGHGAGEANAAKIIMPRVIDRPPQVALRPVRADDRYRLVCLSFPGCYWVRVEPMVSDESVIDYSLFDTSELARFQWKGPAEEYVSSFRQEWSRSGVCPDPQFYEVVDGDWLRSVPNTRSKLRQFLLVAPESSVHLLAQEWAWSTKGALDDW